MRVVVTLMAIVFAATVIRAQTPTTQPSDLQVVKYSWSKDRIDWDKTPFGRRTEISDVRSRRGQSWRSGRPASKRAVRRNQPNLLVTFLTIKSPSSIPDQKQ